ncbi:hypothetical protein Gpo141_00005661 [Globisporangium polare]
MGRRHRPQAPTSGDVPSDAAAAQAAAVTALPWDMATMEMQPSSLTSLTDDKLARFVIGRQKKTKFEKDREEREARKRQADDEAAQIYAKFVASFENEDDTLGKAFVRGETVVQGNAQHQPSHHQHGELYRLKPKDGDAFRSSSSVPIVSGTTAAAMRPGKKFSEMDRMLEEMKQKDAERQVHREQHQAASITPGGAGPPKKRREIDQFLEELKEREPVAPSMDEMGLGKGSFDHGDPTTTNLYVGNLAPTVTEEALEALFGKYGEINSVKIMWPRTEEERARKRNCGFVSFFDRLDADEARMALHDKELDSHAMVVGWGKAVKIDLSLRKSAARAVVPPVAPIVPVGGTSSEAKAQIQVELPGDREIRERVDRLARYVAKDGVQFENAIRAREASNPEFAFLFETSQTASALATYYRWRVFAFAMGDEDDVWRAAPFQMTLDGPVWVPPQQPTTEKCQLHQSELQPRAIVFAAERTAEPQSKKSELPSLTARSSKHQQQ